MKELELTSYIITVKSIFGMNYGLKKDEINGKRLSVVRYND